MYIQVVQRTDNKSLYSRNVCVEDHSKIFVLIFVFSTLKIICQPSVFHIEYFTCLQFDLKLFIFHKLQHCVIKKNRAKRQKQWENIVNPTIQ